jgi:hypothetical protein
MIISVDLKDGLLAALLERSGSVNSTPEELINSLLASALGQPEADTIDHGRVINDALAEVRKLPSGEEFALEKVIHPDTWQLMSTGDRKSFGKAFRKQAEGSGLAEWSYRNGSNKAIYIRKP